MLGSDFQSKTPSFEELFEVQWRSDVETAGLPSQIAASCRHSKAGICFPHLPATEFAPDLLAATELDFAISGRQTVLWPTANGDKSAALN